MAKKTKRRLSKKDGQFIKRNIAKADRRSFFNVTIKSTLILGIIFLFVIVLPVGIYTGYFGYINGYLKCGMKTPVVVSYRIGGVREYSLPTDKDYPGPVLFASYVCSEQEALDLDAEHAPFYEY